MTVALTETQVPLSGFVGEVLAGLGEAVIEVHQCCPRRGIARIDPARALEVARKMFAIAGSRLATATGIEVRDGIDVLYHWCIESHGRPASADESAHGASGRQGAGSGASPAPGGVVITLKALAARPELTLDSIAPIVAAANWIEREMHDLLGANFRNHPDMRRLLLDDSWPEGLHPLRKGFDQVADRPPLPPNMPSPDVQERKGQS